jgi:hypothetical protein
MVLSRPHRRPLLSLFHPRQTRILWLPPLDTHTWRCREPETLPISSPGSCQSRRRRRTSSRLICLITSLSVAGSTPPIAGSFVDRVHLWPFQRARMGDSLATIPSFASFLLDSIPERDPRRFADHCCSLGEEIVRPSRFTQDVLPVCGPAGRDAPSCAALSDGRCSAQDRKETGLAGYDGRCRGETEEREDSEWWQWWCTTGRRRRERDGAEKVWSEPAFFSLIFSF